jgi:hypothetical protein
MDIGIFTMVTNVGVLALPKVKFLHPRECQSHHHILKGKKMSEFAIFGQ